MITKTSFYNKVSLVFMGLLALLTMLYLAQAIILPILYSIIIATSLNPIVVFLISKKINHILSIVIAMSVIFLITTALLILIASQLSVFSDTYPLFVNKFYEGLKLFINWASSYFNISTYKINTMLAETKIGIINTGKSSMGSVISSMSHWIFVMVLVPVYVFMFLFYKPLLLDFFRRLFGINHLAGVNDVLTETKIIIQKYLIALVLEATIIAILNSVGLLLIGIDYAILLGVIGALLNVIPYVGGIIAVSLPAMIAITTKSSSSYLVLVLLLYIVIQFIDNHYISPKVVASKVKINALVSIIAVLCGSALWGLPGMFLSIPLTAIIKVICDHVESLKPWGFLLGDTMPTITVFKLKLKKVPSL